MTVVISHQACDQGWKITPKCRRNKKTHVRSFTRYIQHSLHPVMTQDLPGNTSPSLITDNAPPSLCPYRVFSRQQPMSSCPQHRGANRHGRRMIQHCLSPGFLIPALPRMFPTILTPCPQGETGALCFAHPGQSRCPTVTTAPSSWRRFYTLQCRLLDYSSLPDCLPRATSSAKHRKPLEQAASRQTASCIITGMR